MEDGSTVEKECFAQRNAYGSGLLLDLKMVDDAVQEEFMSMRSLQVYHEVFVSYIHKSGLKGRWIYTTKATLRILLSEHGWLHKKPRE